jgi:hypothetical protein
LGKEKSLSELIDGDSGSLFVIKKLAGHFSICNFAKL